MALSKQDMEAIATMIKGAQAAPVAAPVAAETTAQAVARLTAENAALRGQPQAAKSAPATVVVVPVIAEALGESGTVTVQGSHRSTNDSLVVFVKGFVGIHPVSGNLTVTGSGDKDKLAKARAARILAKASAK